MPEKYSQELRAHKATCRMQVVKYREKGQRRIGAIAADLPVKEFLAVPLNHSL